MHQTGYFCAVSIVQSLGNTLMKMRMALSRGLSLRFMFGIHEKAVFRTPWTSRIAGPIGRFQTQRGLNPLRQVSTTGFVFTGPDVDPPHAGFDPGMQVC
jgi:hypothetical protein